MKAHLNNKQPTNLELIDVRNKISLINRLSVMNGPQKRTALKKEVST